MAIPALMGGTVKQVFVNNKSAGHGVVVQGSDGREYRYIHMKYKPKLKVGDKVSAGQNLGQIGSTGYSTGPHLDLKIKDKNGKYIDPMSVINSMAKGSKSSGSKQTSASLSGGYNNYKKLPQATNAKGYPYFKSLLTKAVTSGAIPNEWAVPLTELIGRESTWNNQAKNPKSTAFGYGQFLKSTRQSYEKKMGMTYSNPYNQILMTAQYVKDRYGDPIKALQHHDSKNWY